MTYRAYSLPVKVKGESESVKNKLSKGIHANNRDFREFDQVNKTQTYQLSETADTEAFDDNFEVKTCDMSLLYSSDATDRAAFVQSLGSAMQEIGFVVLINHGIDETLFVQAEQKIETFFESATTHQLRNQYLAKRQGSVNQGYFPVKQTSQIHPDLVEGWVFCRRAFNFDQDPDFNEKEFWPVSGYEPFFRKLCLAQESLILPIMQSILNYLGCDPHCYDEKLYQTNFGLRLNYYPPLGQDDIDAGGGRMLGHEDVDLFTFLPAQDLDGLQVLNRHTSKWIRLTAPEGSIVLNTGDYMQRITNDRLPSTTHRVAVPRDKLQQARRRISFPMAIYLWEEEILEVLPGLGNSNYEPIMALEFHRKTTSKYYGANYAVSGIDSS